MVRILVRHDDCEGEFLYDCSSTSPVDEIASEIVRISNLQSKIRSISLQLEPRLLPLRDDPSGIALMRALTEARSYASKDQVLHNKPLSLHLLRDHIQTMEKEFISHYELLGFTDSSQLHQLLAEIEDRWVNLSWLDHIPLKTLGPEILQEDTTQLWWAGKELLWGKRLSDYIRKNDKTKIVLRLKSAGSGPA